MRKCGRQFLCRIKERKMRILKYGSTGPAVELLQLALDRAGFGELALDGIFGTKTKNAGEIP